MPIGWGVVVLSGIGGGAGVPPVGEAGTRGVKGIVGAQSLRIESPSQPCCGGDRQQVGKIDVSFWRPQLP